MVKARKSEAVGEYFWHLSLQANITVFSLNSKKNIYQNFPYFSCITICSLFCMQSRTVFFFYIKRPERMHGVIVASYRRRCGVMVASTSGWYDVLLDFLCPLGRKNDVYCRVKFANAILRHCICALHTTKNYET